jgi:hypothetical protein
LEVSVHAEYSRVFEGLDVLDAKGEKIGTCGGMPGDYFSVDAAVHGVTRYHVPFSAISCVSENQIFLNVRKEHIDSMGWNQQPTATHTGEIADQR